jgi:DNA-binding SARP family transcriptional activator
VVWYVPINWRMERRPPGVEFRALGQLEVAHRGASLDLGSPKHRALLAILLIHANEVVPSERLLEDLWRQDAAGKENALWVHISRLRSALEPDRVGPGAARGRHHRRAHRRTDDAERRPART